MSQVKRINNFIAARAAKKDEFYTQITDIEKEMKHYRPHFKDKVIFMNCDDPQESNFWKFFYNNFEFFGLKKIISTHYEAEKKSYKLEYDGKEIVKTDLLQNGDFRSPEAIELLKQSNITITNPPFSLFREYVQLLDSLNKKFIILGNNNAITSKELFALFKSNRLWLGTNSNQTMRFEVPMDYPKGEVIDGKKYGSVPAISWFTNLEHNKRNEELFLFRSINDKKVEYRQYENYDAINVDKVADIPKDYYGLMGVPITFLDKYNPNQFEIIGIDGALPKTDTSVHAQRFVIDGKVKYARIVIKRRTNGN